MKIINREMVLYTIDPITEDRSCLLQSLSYLMQDIQLMTRELIMRHVVEQH